MSLDPIQTTHFVLQVLDAWLLKNTGTGFKSGKTIPENPRKGYGISWRRYLKLCDDMTATLVKSTGRSFQLSSHGVRRTFPMPLRCSPPRLRRFCLAANLKARGRMLAEVAANIDLG